MNLIQALKDDRQFTPNEKRIAAYILGNLVETSQFTLADLSTKTYTSHSAIIRLTQKLGYEGFRDFRVALIALAQETRFTQMPVDADFPFKDGDSTTMIMKKMADLTTQTIQAMQANLDTAVLEAVVDACLQAKRIFIFAKGDTQITARSFQSKMTKLGIFIVIAEEYANGAWVASNIQADDCAIFTSYRADSVKYERYLELLNEKDVPTVLISSRDASVLTDKATHWLTTVDLESMDSLKIGTFSSQIAIEYIFNVVYSMIYMKDYTYNNEQVAKKYANIAEGALDD
ncbi:MurR/RpiR family transcriptional regulator [Aerococcus agrisoli]|uniref:MurR/RpiR family transcriptional regulator n=1 Tax=Aerococcus agrisoli TaxID=2487350 RepID=A0A3N4H354_9LACT|nr:MurR/RpiR family transcriptional regulator [Aerococcus agrisoli]RPA59594.1 MurR/RpiR family transcriptional regulator [Aerococcus agrisoli]